MLIEDFERAAIICTTGRTEEDLEMDGTGTGLWLQNGRNPFENVKVPMNREDAIAEGWTRNQCNEAMGENLFQAYDHEGRIFEFGNVCL